MPDEDAPTPDVDSAVRDLLANDEHASAAETVLRRYGPELLGYLHAVAPSATEAEDIFSDYCERLLRNLGTFRGESSVRTWSYRVVRNLVIDRQRANARRRARGETPDHLSRIAAKIRTETATYLESQMKDRLAELRASLPEEDRTLLILRVDRQLPWSEVADIMLDAEGRSLGTARLRKRFERLVARLREHLAGS